MEIRITDTELAKSLSDVLNRVRYRGERFIVERGGEPVAMLAPTRPVQSITLGELLDRLADMPVPDDRFADDMETVQQSQPRVPAPSWPS